MYNKALDVQENNEFEQKCFFVLNWKNNKDVFSEIESIEVENIELLNPSNW